MIICGAKTMMRDYNTAEDVICRKWAKKNKKYYSDDIYTFDIETSSMFYIDNHWMPFYYIDGMDYDDIPKAGVPYIWMFGINEDIYYGREFYDFQKMLDLISHPLITKVIWVHNLAFEFAWLTDILDKYTIEHLVALQKHKPICFYVKELNIMFRCSYMLTNMSLANAAKEYTKLEKKSGDLQYNVVRSPLTRLTERELGYCEYDCVVLYHIIKFFRDQYKHICKIPNTSTARVRKAIQDEVDYWYIRKQQQLTPTPEMYIKLWYAFAGGYTHANIINANKVITGIITSKDIASSYPTVMVTEKYPSTAFVKCKVSEFLSGKKRETHAYLLHVRFIGVKAKYYNHYLQFEKVKNNVVNAVTDNGRIVSCDSCQYYLTDIDYDIMLTNYDIDKVEILECYHSFKRYLDIRIIKFILSHYRTKTSKKGFTSEDPEEEESVLAYYRYCKTCINGIYGMSVTSILHNACYDSDTNKWVLPPELDPERDENAGKTKEEMFRNFVEAKLEDTKTSYSNLFFYAVGVWVTSYARRNLIMRVLENPDLDRDSIYMDTDSIKYTGNYDYIFEEYNKQLLKKYEAICEYYDELSIDMFIPEDLKGRKHPIGFFEDDGEYSEFCTIGAKKYCYRSVEDGELHITVSGVSKSGVKALDDDITNFKKGFVWGYQTSGKLMHKYVTDQEEFEFTDCQGNKYRSKQRNAVVLYPTTYTLGISDWYEQLIKLFEDRKFIPYRR